MWKPHTILVITAVLLASALSPAAQAQVDSEGSEANYSLTDAIIAVLTPEQAEQFLAGTDPAELLLEDGRTLEEFIAQQAIDTASASAYHPLPRCLVVRTSDSLLGQFSAGELRQFLLRGPATDLSAQGGNASGCGVAAGATAAVLSLKVNPGNFAGWAAVSAVGERLLRVMLFEARRRAYTMVALPLGTAGDWKMKLSQPGQVVAHVVGYFSPLVEAELPAHTHDGDDIVAGEVDEDFIDPAITRDTELVLHTAARDNPHVVTMGQLTPTTTKGDLLVEDGVDVVRFPVGTDGQVLVADSTQEEGMRWASFASGCPICSAPALVPRTGQVTSYGDRDDGELQRGVVWPEPRFTDNGNGTITDNLTGLIWLQKANCIATEYPGFDGDDIGGDGRVTWQHALDFVAGMNVGTYSACASGETDWRLPNRLELESLLDMGSHSPALSNTEGTGGWTTDGDAFSGVESLFYWSSTTLHSSLPDKWRVSFDYGNVNLDNELNSNYVWPVRSGQ